MASIKINEIKLFSAGRIICTGTEYGKYFVEVVWNKTDRVWNENFCYK